MAKSQRDSFLRHVRVWAKAYEDLGIDALVSEREVAEAKAKRRR